MNKAERVARRLLKANRSGVSWREMAKGFKENTGTRIPHGTLSTFAKAKGKYIPKNPIYQIALGLKHLPFPPRRYTLPEYPAEGQKTLERRAQRMTKEQARLRKRGVVSERKP